MDLPVVLFDHLYLTEGEHDNCPLPVDDLQRFIGNIQKKYMFHLKKPCKLIKVVIIPNIGNPRPPRLSESDGGQAFQKQPLPS